MRLYLIRHPRTLAHPGMCYGRTEWPADPDEIVRAMTALVRLLPLRVPVHASPLGRCMQLAAPLAQALEAGAVIADQRLAELDFGQWDGQLWDAIPRSEIDAWAQDPVEYRPGDGENVLQAAGRVWDWLADRTEAVVIVVCHGGTIRLLRAMSGAPTVREAARRAVELAAPDYGSLTIVDLPAGRSRA